MLYLIIAIQLIIIVVLIKYVYIAKYWQNQAEAWAKSNDTFHQEWEGRQ